MVLDLIISKSDDGFNAEIPSIKGCDCWAHEEDEAVDKSIELLKYYLNLEDDSKINIDRARKENFKTIYKLVFNKDLP